MSSMPLDFRNINVAHFVEEWNSITGIINSGGMMKPVIKNLFLLLKETKLYLHYMKKYLKMYGVKQIGFHKLAYS